MHCGLQAWCCQVGRRLAQTLCASRRPGPQHSVTAPCHSPLLPASIPVLPCGHQPSGGSCYSPSQNPSLAPHCLEHPISYRWPGLAQSLWPCVCFFPSVFERIYCGPMKGTQGTGVPNAPVELQCIILWLRGGSRSLCTWQEELGRARGFLSFQITLGVSRTPILPSADPKAPS